MVDARAEGGDEVDGVLDAIAQMERAIGQRLIVCASGWSGDRGVDLDERAARVIAELIERHTGARPAFSLWLVGRGGHASFADGLRRALSPRGVERCYVVGSLIWGAASIAALRASRFVWPAISEIT